jgi:hypothetical protein
MNEAMWTTTQVVAEVRNSARYIYCIVPCEDFFEPGNIGIDGARVYCIPYQNIAAVVHDCPEEPYQGDDETVKGFVLTHNNVVDTAWEKTGSVIPMTFDVIVKADQKHTADENVIAWLHTEYHSFLSKLTEFKGKVELGIQILWDTHILSQLITESNKTIQKLQEEMTARPKGMAYFIKQKIEKALKGELEKKADVDYRRYYEQISSFASDIHVNKVKKLKDKQMLMNLSALTEKEKIKALGEELSKIEAEEGVSVRFTGPWPPYSFVTTAAAKRET